MQDDEVMVTEDKIDAVDVNVEPLWPGLFAKVLVNVNIKSVFCNTGAGGPTPGAAAPVGGPAPPPLLLQLRRKK